MDFYRLLSRGSILGLSLLINMQTFYLLLTSNVCSFHVSLKLSSGYGFLFRHTFCIKRGKYHKNLILFIYCFSF